MSRMPWDHPKEESASVTATSPEEMAKLAQDSSLSREDQDGFEQRISSSMSPDSSGETTAEARLVPHHLLVQLRSYPRLRNLVLAFLVVQERFEWLGGVRSDLQKATKEPDTDFWERLQRQFGGMGLRGDFPTRLLDGEDAIPEFAELVDEFDDRYAKVAAAAEAALNPSQSAQSFTEALAQVSAMRMGAIKLARRCKELARTLLEDLDQTVNMIFAGEARPARSEDRDKASGSPEAAPSLSGPAGQEEDRHGREKQLLGAGSSPDVRGHLLFSSKEGT